MNYYKYPYRNRHHQPNRFCKTDNEADQSMNVKKIYIESKSQPSTKVLLKIAVKKIFRLKTIPILFNYFLRKSGLASATKRLEEQTVKAASTFFES